MGNTSFLQGSTVKVVILLAVAGLVLLYLRPSVCPTVPANNLQQTQEVLQRLTNMQENLSTQNSQTLQLQSSLSQRNADYDRLRAEFEETKKKFEEQAKAGSARISELEGELAAANKLADSAAAASATTAVADASGKAIGSVFGLERPCTEFLKSDKAYTRYVGDPCPYTVQAYDKWPNMPPLCQYLSIECRVHQGQLFNTAQSLLGAGIDDPWHMTSHADVMFFEFVLARYLDIDVVVELGTAGGITSMFYGVAMRMRGGKFYSFDIGDHRNKGSKLAWLDNMEFVMEDMSYPSPSEMANGNAPNKRALAALKSTKKRAMLFADNGSKTWEVNNYCPHLKLGDVIVTHDWDMEITWNDVKDALTANGFERIYFDFAEHIGSEARAFIKVK